MSESWKGSSSTAGSKKESKILDDELGEELLMSWTLGGKGTDPLDFDCETVPIRKKHTFSSDKLDEDFAFDGCFEKLASFKVDMSDLDFSSPPRNPQKNSKTGKEAEVQEDRTRERFKFSFDFNELGNFDLNQSMMKGESKSRAISDIKGFDDFDKCDKNQEDLNRAKRNDSPSENIHIDDMPKGEKEVASKLTSPSVIDEEIKTAQKISSYTSVLTADRNSLDDVLALPTRKAPKQDHEAANKAIKSEISAEKSAMKSKDPILQIEPPPSKTVNCAVNSEVSDSTCLVPSGTLEQRPSSQSKISNPDIVNNSKAAAPKCTSKPENGDGSSSDKSDHVAKENVNDSAPVQSGEHAVVTSARQETMPNKLEALGGNISSIAKITLVPMQKTSKNELNLMMDKRNEAIGTNLLNKLKYSNSLVHFSATSKQNHGLYKQHMEHICSESNVENASKKAEKDGKQQEHQAKDNPVSCGPATLKDNSANISFLLSEKIATGKSKEGPSKHLGSNVSPRIELKMASIGKSMSSPHNIERICDISSLKRDLSSPRVQNAMALLRSSNENVNKSLTLSRKNGRSMNEANTPLSPSLKRKSIERPSADAVVVNPLKRLTTSPFPKHRFLLSSTFPSEIRYNWILIMMHALFMRISRKARVASPIIEEKQVSVVETAEDAPHDGIHHPSPIGVALLKSTTADLDVHLLLGNDENIEKAEAYSKELEDMCSLLKKKHEEAKEVLVQAIVNNNFLLMLNHPIYEEKIHAIQSYANNLLSKEYLS
ncbi:uncharacterized protein At4g18490 isoform X2 [Amborella trichopoda]|uniref:uncharacterized protein At4g18490 isoform X2 n=1 Tax=Amborella trichopoda TaxID=13333 RepID=UPI0009C10ED1|nr:uncharacterized protein At4g18490 isoform X2 [Amborella trichopoda]|eukprot:XP_020527860.1 uncharacterized protein At4g18490 isoform X2 [Amborella trichopoda]